MDEDFGGGLITGFLLAFAVMCIFWMGGCFYNTDTETIKSGHVIEPVLKLDCYDEIPKCDSIWVYVSVDPYY